jgi:hypothetical protein
MLMLAACCFCPSHHHGACCVPLAEINGYDKNAKQKGAINFMNLGAFALARFDSVAKLKNELQNNMQVCLACLLTLTMGSCSWCLDTDL